MSAEPLNCKSEGQFRALHACHWWHFDLKILHLFEPFLGPIANDTFKCWGNWQENRVIDRDVSVVYSKQTNRNNNGPETRADGRMARSQYHRGAWRVGAPEHDTSRSLDTSGVSRCTALLAYWNSELWGHRTPSEREYVTAREASRVQACSVPECRGARSAGRTCRSTRPRGWTWTSRPCRRTRSHWWSATRRRSSSLPRGPSRSRSSRTRSRSGSSSAPADGRQAKEI